MDEDVNIESEEGEEYLGKLVCWHSFTSVLISLFILNQKCFNSLVHNV